MRRTRPSARQVAATTAVVSWYLERHYGTASDPGMPAMFMDPARVGAFAITEEQFRAGDASALFRLLVATSMFQRRQDQQIMRVLREMPATRAREVTSARRLLRLVDESGCPNAVSVDALISRCDLAKDTTAQRGYCTAEPKRACRLKEHTVWLRRYGHFGKVPTSLAMLLREEDARDLNDLRAAVIARCATAAERAVALEAVLCRSWRVNQKIASMFLSMACNPDLPPRSAPWSTEIDWTYYVVVDSNVDLFLGKLRYGGGSSYDARREFVRAVAERIDLSRLEPTLTAYNPRLVQQAMYLFMSITNRRTIAEDCMHIGASACAACPRAVSALCSARAPAAPA